MSVCPKVSTRLPLNAINVKFDNGDFSKIFNREPLTKRSQGRPKNRWEDNIKQDVCQLKIKNWISCVQDHGKWKEVVEKAKTFN
jgi:hypothetical protein